MMTMPSVDAFDDGDNNLSTPLLVELQTQETTTEMLTNNYFAARLALTDLAFEFGQSCVRVCVCLPVWTVWPPIGHLTGAILDKLSCRLMLLLWPRSATCNHKSLVEPPFASLLAL